MNQKNPLRLLALSGPLVRKQKPSWPTFLNRSLKWLLSEIPATDLVKAAAQEDFGPIPVLRATLAQA
jgi:hypothetical protein